MFAALLIPALCFPPAQEAATNLALESATSSDEPLMAALSPDGRRLFAISGLDLVELEQEGSAWRILDRVRVDVTPKALCVTDRRIYVAGGSQGCWAVDYSAGMGEPRALPSEPETICMDVTTDRRRVAVLYSNYASMTIHVLDKGGLSLRQRIQAPASRSYAIAWHGDYLYVAQGEQGVTRLDLQSESPASARRPSMPLAGFFASDVCVAGGRLWVAGGAAGLVTWDLGGDWGADPPRQPLSSSSRALRVSASGLRVVVGIQPEPAGTPVSTQSPDAQGAGFASDDGTISLHVLETDAWRSLDLAGDRCVAVDSMQGVRVGNLAGKDPDWVVALGARVDAPPDETHCHAFGDYLSMSPAGTQDSLLIYTRRAMELFTDGHLKHPPNPYAVLEAAQPHGLDPPAPWSSASLDMGPGRWLVVCAAGSGRSAEDPELAVPRLLTFLVDDQGVRPLGEGLGADGPGQAVGVAAFEVHGRRWALLASIGGKLELFDLTHPERPRVVVHQPLAPDPWDASAPSLLDVVVVQPAGFAPQALVAAGGAGLLRLDLSGLAQTPPRPDLIPDEVIDTPGWATGVSVQPSAVGGLRVELDDGPTGSRVYLWRFEASPHPAR